MLQRDGLISFFFSAPSRPPTVIDLLRTLALWQQLAVSQRNRVSRRVRAFIVAGSIKVFSYEKEPLVSNKEPDLTMCE